MNKKIPVGIAVALILVSVVATVTVTVPILKNKYSTLLRDLPQKAAQYKLLSEVDELVRAEYYGDCDYGIIDNGLAAGYIEGLRDEYSFYISPDDYDGYSEVMSGKLSGIGATLFFDRDKEIMLITDVRKNSPAESAGLKKDDIVKKINGSDVTADNSEALIGAVGNASSGSTKLEIETKGDKGASETKKVTVSNGYRAVSCTYSVSGTVGYIRINNFYDYTVNEFSDAVKALTEAEVNGIILDLRNNYSNNLESAIKVLDKIVPVANGGTGALATAKNAANETVKVFTSDAESISLPFAVLINDRTEGVAELIAADLRDFGKAKLFGEKTVGHGTMQKAYDLSDGGAVFLTVAELTPYISESYNKKGVAPDEDIAMETSKKNILEMLSFDEDEQYQGAYAYLSKE